MKLEKIEETRTGTDELGPKLAWLGIVLMIFYLVFIDK